jgi:hypothetical protein
MVLNIWFWLSLSGVLLTVETPSYLRGLGILPVLPFVLGLVAVDVADRVVALVRPGARAIRVRRRWPTVAAADLALGLVVLLVVATESVYYFRTYSPPVQAWRPITGEGQQIAELSRGGPVYSLESSEHMVDSGWVRFLAQGTTRGRVANPGQQLPLVAGTADDLRPAKRDASGLPAIPAAGSGLTFLLYPDPNQASYASLLQALYPGGVFLDPTDGRRPYRVSAEALDRTRGVTVETGAGESGIVGTFGEAPRGVVSPTGAWWRGGVRLPQSGRFGFRLAADCPAKLFVDDVPVLAVDGTARGAATQGRTIEAARGLHFVKVGGELCGFANTLTLERAGPLGENGEARYRPFAREETYRLMDAPWGLLGRVVSENGKARASSSDTASLFLDTTVAGAFLSQYMPIKGPPFAVEWAGSLVAARGGTYRVAFASEGEVSLQIDDRPIVVRAVKPEEWKSVGAGTPVELAAGAHRIRIGFRSNSGGRSVIRLNWVPPTADGRLNERGEWTVVPPMVLRPDPSIRLMEAPRSP